MTTESSPTETRPTVRWTAAESREERRRNKEHFSVNETEIRRRFPHHWIVIYECDQVLGFEDGKGLIEHMNTLDDFTRGCSYWVNTLNSNRRPRITNAFRRQ
jgi:hypothetical protein